MSRIWALSIILEPFLYFNLFGDSSTGNLSKILQFIVIIWLISRLPNIKVPHALNALKYINLFLLYSFLSTFFFFLFSLISPSLFSEIFSPYSLSLYSLSPRFLLDLLSIAYKFFYFVLLAPVFLRTDKDFAFLYRALLLFTSVSLLRVS